MTKTWKGLVSEFYEDKRVKCKKLVFGKPFKHF